LKKEILFMGAGVTAVGAAIGVIASNLLIESLSRVALARDLPKSMKPSKPKSEIVRQFHARAKEAGDALRQKDTEEVEVKSRDGLRLIGHWYPCENAKRVIIAMHGWRSAWYIDFGMLSNFWHKEGCSVLFAEQRGQGGSGGAYMGFGLTERFDCRDWARWLSQKQSRELPIYLSGVSMGAATVLMAADLSLPENVRGIIADCGFTSPHAIWKHVAEKNLHLSFGIRGRVAEEMCRRKLQQGSRDFSAPQALQSTSLPVLLIHGTADHFVPVEMTYENYEACAGEKQLFIVPGADHGMSYFKDPEGYEAAMRSFWQRYDGAKA
jgi:fermentation-respiration switch protein FrsA (DUF1100 family)